ncbi:MAG: hypothetical protein F6J93_00425 [Oscillatoria sp. SIO1A7]|nr:hypothetical protein [Oscillatoria sp. SIO1A7]
MINSRYLVQLTGAMLLATSGEKAIATVGNEALRELEGDRNNKITLNQEGFGYGDKAESGLGAASRLNLTLANSIATIPEGRSLLPKLTSGREAPDLEARLFLDAAETALTSEYPSWFVISGIEAESSQVSSGAISTAITAFSNRGDWLYNGISQVAAEKLEKVDLNKRYRELEIDGLQTSARPIINEADKSDYPTEPLRASPTEQLRQRISNSVVLEMPATQATLKDMGMGNGELGIGEKNYQFSSEDIALENSANLLVPSAIATEESQKTLLVPSAIATEESQKTLLVPSAIATEESQDLVLENSDDLLLPKAETSDAQDLVFENSGNLLLPQGAVEPGQDLVLENSGNLLLPKAETSDAQDLVLENSDDLLLPKAETSDAQDLVLENSGNLLLPQGAVEPGQDLVLENSGNLLLPKAETSDAQDLVLENSDDLLLPKAETSDAQDLVLENSGNLLLPQGAVEPGQDLVLENSDDLLLPQEALEPGQDLVLQGGIGHWGLGIGENNSQSSVQETIPPLENNSQFSVQETIPSNPPSKGGDCTMPNAGCPMPDTQLAELDSPSLKILAPAVGETLDAPAATVILQFPVGSEIELQVNGKPVPRDLIGRTETSEETVTQTWYGVPLEEGENAITANIVDSETGSESDSQAIGQAGSEPQCPMPNAPCPTIVFVRGAPTQISVETLEARIPADGRAIATISGQLLDENDKLSTRDAIVTLSTSAGEFVGADYDTDQPGFQVQAVGGQYTASLRAGFDASTVRIRASIPNQGQADNTEVTVPNRYIEAFTQMEFTTYLRPSLVTGVIDFRLGRRGTDFWDGFENFLPLDEDNEYEADLSGVAFATGRIGNWLFTGAYNSERSLNKGCDCDRNRLIGDTQFNEQVYPTYGDRSTSQRTTPSSDSVYLRFERSSAIANAGPDYFMWGDYNSRELASQSQQFTAFSQVLHGFKGNYTIGSLQVTGMYATDIEGFQRDTIPPDGTGGFYFLSRRLVIEGSENIYIETEELDRPGTVLSRQQLNRGQDYEIDYDRGSLLFHRPILRTDVSTSPDGISTTVVRRIIATYQYESQEGDTNLYGGRLRYHFSRDLDSPTWLGATYIRQDQGIRDFELYGADMLLSFGDPTAAARGQLIAEYAHSTNNSEILGLVVGEAYRVDFNGFFGPLNLNSYYRSTDTGFANDTTTSFVPGQTRYGGRLNANLTNSTQLQLSYDYEKNTGTAPRPLTAFEDLTNPRTEPIPGVSVDNSLSTITAGLQQRIGPGTFGLDYIRRNREDNLATSPLDTTSSQLRSRLLVPITDKLSVHAQNEINLSDEQDLVYPNRTIIGADFQVLPGVSLAVNHQFFSGGQFDDNSITTVGLNGNYNLTDNTVLTGRYSFVNSQTMSAALGIQHGWTIRPGLRLNLAYEHIFGSLFDRSSSSTQFSQPFAPGQSASSLGIRGGDTYSIGLEYTDNPDFQASARYDRRFSSSGNNTVIAAAATGKPTEWLSILARYQQASSSNPLLDDIGDTINLRLGVAYRHPTSDKLNALLRYEFRQNPSTIPDTILFGSGTRSEDHTLALETIYAPSWQWELYGKYAWRKSTSFLADDLAGTSMLSLTQLRATYRFAYRWDLAAEGRWIHQPEASFDEIGAVAELGFYITPDLRLSAGYVFGNVSDREFDRDRSAGGPYVGLTMKLNQLWPGFGNQSVTPVQPVQEEF